MTNASRAQVDLDALARDLRQDRGGAQGGKPDPLAELARIVGQDDPFRALLAARDEMRGAAATQPQAKQQDGWNGRVEPSFAPEVVKPNPADAFDQYLASVERDTHQEAATYGAEAEEAQNAVPDYEDGRGLRRANPRRRLASVGAGIAIVAVAVTGALTYKALHGSGGSGGVPVIQADSTPLKVAPKVADGVEIPDQNRQIYDPKGKSKDGQIKIVNREEQPIDVAEAARAAQGTGPAGGAQSGTTPGNGPFEAFGEPRRVRTVAVKPETPPAPPQREAQADAGPTPIPTMVLPTDEPPQAKQKPGRQAAAALPTPVPAPVEAPPPPTPVEAPQPKPVAVKPPPKAAQRVAAVVPPSPPAQDAPDAAAEADAAIRTGSTGGYAVQLGVRSSAAEAKAAFRQMQAKFGQLSGKPELIRQAEVNGKTIFRVRVGPLAKTEAASLCSALQGEGGQCFVAKN
ncbi:SPOR domain-containing protein [Methylobacterium sp. NEAU K]|uniref:SPOR domain-containing protein n=1 Tax=Methylobacterium sp. NEAU K TaxID=3064946 RepID=UPI002734FBDB|nr:SPOR domain-containing protein [Methylobacterium sp. NEAU K]MDP4002981.1 SPOR domain-containing protein [Methylobacterium sp. NEAU K]